MVSFEELRGALAAWAETVHETHISLVYLRGEDAFKLKKPVDLGFLDFSSAERRRVACEAEVQLNGRLSKDVYHGVLPVTRDRNGNIRPGGEGPVIDWVVHMRRLRDENRADLLLERGELAHDDISTMAATISEFHRKARCDAATQHYGEPSVVEDNVKENFEQTRSSIHRYLPGPRAKELEAWQREFLRTNGETLSGRAAAGHSRDGHGDLRLEHFYLEPTGMNVIDCIEFNERFRFGDTCADLAFLAMDLRWRGRPDLSEHLLAQYASDSGDFGLYRVIDFYESYRAHVRAKVAAMIAEDDSFEEETRRSAAAEARRYYALALAEKRRGNSVAPAIIAVGGIIGAGKSTLANALQAELCVPVVSTDRVRKQMQGIPEDTNQRASAFEGQYRPARTARVYEAVLEAAEAIIASGRTVILDASFRESEMRLRARDLARQHGARFCFVEARASHDTCRSRLVERARRGKGPSDASVELFDVLAAGWQPPRELSPGEHVVVDTERPPAQVAHGLLSRLSLS